MPDIDETHREVKLTDQDAVLIVTKDGETLMIEPPFTGPIPQHVRLVEGICKALSHPTLFQEMLALADKGHALGEAIETVQPPAIN